MGRVGLDKRIRQLDERHNNLFLIDWKLKEMSSNIYNRLCLFVNHKLFSIHHRLIKIFYGNLDDFYINQISEPLRIELHRWIETQESSIFSEFYVQPSILISTSNLNKNIQLNLDNNLAFFPNLPPYLTDKLHFELNRIYTKALKSKVCFVNTRIWVTKANSNKFGPTDLHNDGFMPGHLKVMIYLDKLNAENGTLQIQNEILNDHREGVCVLFKNSEVLHAGIPGSLRDRYSIEVTLMRSFFNIIQ